MPSLLPFFDLIDRDYKSHIIISVSTIADILNQSLVKFNREKLQCIASVSLFSLITATYGRTVDVNI